MSETKFENLHWENRKREYLQLCERFQFEFVSWVDAMRQHKSVTANVAVDADERVPPDRAAIACLENTKHGRY